MSMLKGKEKKGKERKGKRKKEKKKKEKKPGRPIPIVEGEGKCEGGKVSLVA